MRTIRSIDGSLVSEGVSPKTARAVLNVHRQGKQPNIFVGPLSLRRKYKRSTTLPALKTAAKMCLQENGLAMLWILYGDDSVQRLVLGKNGRVYKSRRTMPER